MAGGHFHGDDLYFRHVHRAEQAAGVEPAGGQIAVPDRDAFGQGIAHAHDHAALYLPFIERAVDDAA